MTVQIKLLKGFKNHYNHEMNTLSLLVKSNYELIEHLSNSKEKLLIALTSIIDHYKNDQDIYFYHKLQVSHCRKPYYLKTKRYKLISPKLDLENSLKDLISISHSIANSKFISHFINFIIVKDNVTIELSKDEFRKLSNIIMSKSTYINTLNNNKISHFIDDDDNNPFEKASINMNNKESLFIDDDDYDNDNDPFEKALNNIKDRNSQLKKHIKIINKKYLSFLKRYIDYLTL